ncbi:ribosome recycling factor [Bacillus vallismortis]|uniref:Ribosome-recycling factor n=1 Tax=Bacillus vallismortis TaxID=72361 RepID=A0ABY4Y4F3_BACVA|nr:MULTISPECIES: ribosome recycling factor [Bacillus]MBL3647148.1 ribosome recycling factor [Bacillus sp. RHFS10]MDM5301770.1 ribosome recycling factor [Bacillus subtilis]MDM5323823.1 ribosome recycling factor [Bacillus subtilis]TYS11780.1 ribosome recycling factor [Bacillus subtilis]USP97152.1 ribosome recycling factor [Bacillus vallismortis]
MSKEVLTQTKEKMEKAIAAYQRELATVRAGRANPSLLDKVTVEYYGAQTPLNQLSSINVPEARMLVVTPYDKTAIGDIEKAILKADLGVTPTSDGNMIRIAIPALTEERRKELVKVVKKYAEEAKVAVRNVRRDANDDLKKLEKNGDITEDELRASTEDVQKLTDEYVSKIDGVTKDKEKEIMEV